MEEFFDTHNYIAYPETIVKLARELIKVVEYLDFEDFKDNLQSLSKEICFELKDHIFKENYILYPTALEAIKDEKLWENMIEKCDDIGYCPFTPKECIEK